MTFRFAYNHILNLKEKEKDQAFSEYGRMASQRDKMAEQLQSIIGERDERQHQLSETATALEIQQQSLYIDHLNQKVADATADLIKMEEELRQKQNQLMEKQQDERIWTQLQDKFYQAYKQKEEKLEQDLLDEMATIRFYRQGLEQ
jgi:flagellar export protein FliJ